MKLTFLGTGGARFVTTQQLRATGGIILEMDSQVIHIDPGPGALVRAKEYGVKLNRLTCVIVTHCHPDHYTDAEMVIEAMTHGTTKTGGVLIGNEHVIKGGDDYRPAISPYHLKALGKYHVVKPGDKVKVGDVEIEAAPTFHDEPGGIGLVFRGSKTVGYTSDGSYYGGQEEHFRGCDYLIVDVLVPRGKDWPKHMNTEQAEKLIRLAEPKTALITHFGMGMIKAGPWNEAKYIEEKTGVKTIAAKDGMVISEGAGKEKKEVKPHKALDKWMK